MKDLQALYHLASQLDIPVDYFPMQKREALAIMDTDGSCAIAIDPRKIRSERDERSKLSHELGHCCTGSFYNRFSGYDIRQRHENRADKWAIEHLITADELDDAIARGCTEIWELAEYFQVSEEFMRKAVCWYTHGNLAQDLYF